jgi:hypothetical protein
MPAEREDSKSLVDEKEVEEGRRRRRRSTGEDVRKKFRDTINEWRATPPANQRKQSLFFLPEEKLNSPALPSQPLKLLPTDYGTDVALRQQQCKCLSLAVLSIPRTTTS